MDLAVLLEEFSSISLQRVKVFKYYVHLDLILQKLLLNRSTPQKTLGDDTKIKSVACPEAPYQVLTKDDPVVKRKMSECQTKAGNQECMHV